jgi:transposase-like protein
MGSQGKPTTRRYSPEFKERAVRMVRQLRAETGERHGTIQRVADQIGCGVESLCTRVNQAEIDAGETLPTHEPGGDPGGAHDVRRSSIVRASLPGLGSQRRAAGRGGSLRGRRLG